jgi:VWFA-related protein
MIRAAILTTLVCTTALSQTPAENSPGLKLRTETRAVQIEVTVRDSQGRPVDDLTRQDFTITDQGKARAIQIFSFNRTGDRTDAPATPAPVATLPRNVFSNRGTASPAAPTAHSTVLVLDGINGWFENFVLSRQAVIGLLHKLPPKEQIAIYVIAKFQGLLILQDYTADRDLLLKSIEKYTPPGMRPAPPGTGANPAPRTSSLGSNSPADNPRRPPLSETEHFMLRASEDVRTTFQALAERLAATPGRKNVFWLTQGFPPRQLRGMGAGAWDKTITALNEANIAIHPVDSNGLAGPARMWGPGSIQLMQEMAERTGGTASYARNDLDAALAEGIAASLSSYTLGFYLAEEERDNRFHRLTVRVARRGLKLYYRQGYFAGAEERINARQKKMDLETALLSQVDSDEIGIIAMIERAPGAQPTLRVSLRLDSQGIALKERSGKWEGKVDLVLIERNASGGQLYKGSIHGQIQMTEEMRSRYEDRGPVMTQSIPLVAGAVKLLIIVRDSASGRIGSLTVPLE